MSAPEHHSGMHQSTVSGGRYNVTLATPSGAVLLHAWGLDAANAGAARLEAVRRWRDVFGAYPFFLLDLHTVTGDAT